jgi:hypothetical protein
MPADPQIDKAKRQMQATVETYVEMLGDDDPQKREQADLALRTLLTVAAMQARNVVDTDDPEQVQRLEMILDYSARAMRHGQLMAGLSAEERAELGKVIREHRGRYRQLFSRDPNTQMHAILELGQQGPGGQVVLRWACRQPTWVLRMAGYRTAGKVENPSDALKDAIFSRLPDCVPATNLPPQENEDDEHAYMVRHMYSSMGNSMPFTAEQERQMIYEVLAGMKDTRISPWLLGELTQESNAHDWNERQKRTQMLKLIGSLEDPRAVVSLVPMLDSEDEQITSGSVNGTDYTVNTVDYLLAALIDMTGQKRSDYKMGLDNDWGDEDMKVAFRSEADREAAIKKFKAWYEENAETYKDLTPYTPRGNTEDPSQ